TRRTLLNCTPVHGAYVAYHRGLPVFTVTQTGQWFKVKTLVHGVKMKPRGQKSIWGEVGRVWNLNAEQFTDATFSRKSQWWRFTLVPTTAAELEKSKAI